jgi:NADH-quinone oxidoreductase subunit M
MILTWLILVPLIGGAIALLAGRWPAAARVSALAACALDFCLGLAVWGRAVGGGAALDHQRAWIPQLGISYHVSMDGLSLLLVLLTAFLGMVAVVASWREITELVGPFHFALLATVAGLIGVFLARDLFLFYLFWELMLVPMYLLIGKWGHERRLYAAIKFFLFTFISSLLMLGSILGLAYLHAGATGVLTFDFNALRATPMGPGAAGLIMAGFLAAFLVKLPSVPVHSWLADAHTEAPTGASILLAGALLKTGAYGLLRIAVPLFPEASSEFARAACMLGVISILYGGIVTFSQTSLKRMIAFSSISHMGFVLLGIYAGNEIALQGAILQVLAHGVSTPALFFLAGSFHQRYRTFELDRLGGLWETAPRLGGFTLFFAMAALGLPGLGNFVGEFLVLLGAYRFSPALAIVGAGGFVVSVIYAVRLVQETVHGPNHEGWKAPDLSARETATLAVMSAGILWLGLYPQPVLEAGKKALLPDQRYVSQGAPSGQGEAANVNWRAAP